MPDDVTKFYDDFAPDYHLIFADWHGAVTRFAAVLDRVIGMQVEKPVRLLDCACGIGTQALGLAEFEGYQIHATDLSAVSVERARDEAQRRGLTNINFGVADMRELSLNDTFDAVIACDNAVPHLLTDEDLLRAGRAIRARLREGGLFLASTRDYDELRLERPQATSHRVMHTPDGKRVTFQLWEWADDGETYTLTQFLVVPNAEGWTLRHYATTYRALLRETFTNALVQAGFQDVRWVMPQDSGYYQPLVLARA